MLQLCKLPVALRLWEMDPLIGIASTAMGYITEASGTASTAMGNFTKASGNESTAMGNSSIASGVSATAMVTEPWQQVKVPQQWEQTFAIGEYN